jgi:formylglycine-generating enzyme required for sulfatase activity
MNRSVRRPPILRPLLACACFLGGHFAVAQGNGSELPKAIRSNKDGAEMVLISKGRFVFGSTEHWANKRTILDLPDYYIDRTEVTNKQYQEFLTATGHPKSRFANTSSFGRPRQPVVGVGWPDAEAYCAWAGKRLPTEMEWEKAGRGPNGRIWPWGDKYDYKVFNGRELGLGGPVDVGSNRDSDSIYGVSDMAGNVWEMTSSHYPKESDKAHAMKGGSFLNREIQVKASYRWTADDEKGGATWLGFRCVMVPENLKQWAETLEKSK